MRAPLPNLPLFPPGLILPLGLLAACTAGTDRDSLHPTLPASEAPHAPVREEPLPAGWETCSTYGFEGHVRALREAAPFTFPVPALEALQRALANPGQTAVRAAVLLAHEASPRADEILTARLEERHVAASRELDAGDLVAAAALVEKGPDITERLALLAAGPNPHPDLEVRVEIACSALASGEDAVTDFLLRVLRDGTPAEGLYAADFERKTTRAWSKSRAAEALSARAGVPCTFRPDGSWEDQMREAGRLESALKR